MKTNKSTKFFAILFVLLAAMLTGCANESSESEEAKYMVETGDTELSVYEGFFLSLEEDPNLSHDEIKAWRDHFYNHTREGTYEKKENLSASAVKAILHQDLLSGSTPDEEIELTDFMGNNITFINVNDVNNYVTWVYIEKK